MPGWLRSRASKSPSAIRPKPPPAVRRKSLRELVDIGKFIGIEHRVAQGKEAFGADGLKCGFGFNWCRRAAEGQLKGPNYLVFRQGAGILFSRMAK